jgi:hypothetical protein
MNSQESLENGFKAVCMGLVETDKMYALVLYQNKMDVRVLVYAIEDGEVYDRPLSGFQIEYTRVLGPQSCSIAVRQIARAIISGGLTIYGVRDAVLDYTKLKNKEYLGSEFIYNEG